MSKEHPSGPEGRNSKNYHESTKERRHERNQHYG